MRSALKKYLKEEDVADDSMVRYVAAFIDLNDDGVKEVIVHIFAQNLCGTGGCPTLVLAQTDSSFRIVSRISITRPPIRVLHRRSKGWHDLTVWVQGGGIQPGYEVELPFDGDSYAVNPTVPPARRLNRDAKGEVAISGDATGIPLD